MAADSGGRPPTFTVRNPEFDGGPAELPARFRSRSATTSAHALVDLLLMVAVIIAVTVIRWDAGHLVTSDSVRLGLLTMLVVSFMIGSEGLYARVQARRWPAAVSVVVKAVAVGVGMFSLVGFFAAVGEGARRWVITVALIWTVVLALHHGWRATRPGGSGRNRVLVAGSPRAAVSMRVALRSDRTHTYEVVGFVVDRLTDDIPEIVADMALGTIEDLPHLVDRHGADQVMFCMEGLDGERFGPITRVLNREGVHVSLTGLGDIAPRRVDVSRVWGRPVVFIAPAVRFGWRMAVKRVVDLSVASFLLVVLAPMLAIVSMLIRIVDRQPALFRQQRVGKAGELFTIYKFQTMVADQEDLVIDLRNDLEGPVFKMEGDPRVTPLGRVLRKMSIDELPQLWNVIRGEMSLVGPRPLLVPEVEAAPVHFRDRELVMPGMTGRWQVSGRSNTNFDELDELDRWYVDNWSLSEDLEILARTVPAVLRARGAR